MANNKKYVELIWAGKYDEFKKGNKVPIERPNLPFQPVETINLPRVKGGIQKTLSDDWPKNYPKDWKNLLIWGDNKLVMSSLLKQGWAGKIKLIYIDPPFFTGADFSFKVKVGGAEVEKEQSIIEERAYRDTWHGGIASYLKYMYERLVLMRELLAEDGSIYVHCDWRVGHYLKVMMDEIFGYENFRNEIVWCYTGPGSPGMKQFNRKHDIILWYSKSDKWVFNEDKIRVPLKENLGGGFEGLTKELKKKYMEKGKIPEDWWYIPVIARQKIDGIERTGYETEKPQELIKRIILASSNEGDIVADFFSGSGMFGFIAEKLGRRWIMSDLSKFAIHITRKRLLNIHNSKDLLDETGKKKYGKPARPFEIWNVGNYETVYWQERLDEYLAFMLKLYQAQPLTGFRYLHGKKGDRIVHIGNLNAPVTMDEVEKVILECRANGFNKADILGWEWAYEVNDLAKELARKRGVDLRLIQIPSLSEIKSALTGFDLKLLKIPDEIIEKELIKHVRFHEVAYLEIETKVKGNEVRLKITDFQIPPSKWLDEIKDKIKHFSDLIDYWAVDWDYKGDIFHNGWQSYRTRKEPKLDLEARHKYKESGKKKIMVKVVDVFGNDTNKVIEVVVK